MSAIDGEIDGKGKNGSASRARAHVGPGDGGGEASGAGELQKLGESAASTLLMQGLENDPEIVPLTIEAVKNALRAVQRYYDKHKQEWEVLPDSRTQLAAADLVFKQLVGLPVQKVETKNLNVTAPAASLEVLLKASPSLREATQRMLDRAGKEQQPALAPA